MTGKERLLAMFDGRPVDHLPLMPTTTRFAADVSGIDIRPYLGDHAALIQAQRFVAESFALDHVTTASDPTREAADLGAAVIWRDDAASWLVDDSRPLLAEKSRLNRLAPPSHRVGRMRDGIDAVAGLKAAVGDRLLVEGWVEGPCSLAARLRGLDALRRDLDDDPSFAHDLFSFVATVALEYAREQLVAGADVIGVDDSTVTHVATRHALQKVLPLDKWLIRSIRGMGGRVRLRIGGETRTLLASIGECEADLVELDACVSLSEARQLMGPAQVLLANLDPFALLRDASPEQVVHSLETRLAQSGPRFVVGAASGIPSDTPAANVRAMVDFAHRHRPR